MKNLLVVLAAVSLALAITACGGDDKKPSSSSSSSSNSAPLHKLALDSAFGTGGIATVALNATTHDRFMAVAVSPDGKTYGAGFIIENGDQMMAVARIDDKGALDKTFGKDGIATANASVGRTAELARSIIIQSGKIVVAGVTEHDATAAGDAARDTDVAVARFDSTGKLDSTFGKDGVAKIDLGAGKVTTGTTFVGDNAWGIGGLPGDKLLVYGSKLADGDGRTDSDYVAIGLTSAGALDTAFGTGGKVIVDVEKSGDSPRNVLVQPDGKVIMTGYSAAAADGVVTPVIVRMSAAGVLDTTWGKGGIATAKILAGVTESYQVQQQGNDYVLAGYGRGADASEKVDLVVYRFKANGTYDPSFGKDGVARIDIAKEDDRARNLMVLPDGRILAAGSGKKTPLNVDAMIVLLSKDGVPDTTFGENGALISDLGGPADSWYGLALSPDKKYVYIAGYKGTEGSGNDDSVIARIIL